MISWKYSFEEISKDLELARKKKQALEDLFSAGRISEATHNSLDSDISNTIAEIEKKQRTLAEKMTSRLTDLEEQINTMEMFLANSEIQHVAGEIDDELHERESKAFSLGLDALRQQLDSIRGIVGEILPEVATVTSPPEEAEAPVTVEVPMPEEIIEDKPEPAMEPQVEEIPVEMPEETQPASEAAALEQPTEVAEEVEPAAEEVTAEQSSEAPTEATPPEEPPVQESVETPEVTTEEAEDSLPESDDAVEEPEPPQELAGEAEVEEAATEEEIETPIEEATSDQEEEVVAEEETEW